MTIHVPQLDEHQASGAVLGPAATVLAVVHQLDACKANLAELTLNHAVQAGLRLVALERGLRHRLAALALNGGGATARLVRILLRALDQLAARVTAVHIALAERDVHLETRLRDIRATVRAIRHRWYGGGFGPKCCVSPTAIRRAGGGDTATAAGWEPPAQANRDELANWQVYWQLRLHRKRTSISGCRWAARFFGGGGSFTEAVISQRTCAQGLFIRIISYL